MINRGKMSAVVAVRKGSQRLKNKNLRQLGGMSLLERKLKVLNIVKDSGYLDEIIVNSDCDEMLSIGNSFGCKTHKREAYYASSECSNSEFHCHMGKNTDTDIIFLAPVCSPYVSVKSHIEAIRKFHESDCDSLTSVEKVKNHLWLNGKPINYDLENVPNSQDLPDVLKLTYSITIATKEVMANLRRVVGRKPEFYLLNEIESIDIDTPFDFAVASSVYENEELYDWGSFYDR